MKKSNLVKSVALAAASVTLMSPAISSAADMEKCYGVVKAGKNDCASKKNKHSCAGAASVDGDNGEWVLVPKGLCNRLVNGSKAES